MLGTGDEDIFRGEKNCSLEWGRINLKVTTKIENIEPSTKDLVEKNSQEAVFRTDVKDLTEEMDKKCLALVKLVELTQEEETNMKVRSYHRGTNFKKIVREQCRMII